MVRTVTCRPGGPRGSWRTRARACILEHSPFMQRVHAVPEWFTGRAVLPEPAPSHLSINYGTRPAEPRGMALIICNIIDDTAVQTHYGIVAFS